MIRTTARTKILSWRLSFDKQKPYRCLMQSSGSDFGGCSMANMVLTWSEAGWRVCVCVFVYVCVCVSAYKTVVLSPWRIINYKGPLTGGGEDKLEQ